MLKFRRQKRLVDTSLPKATKVVIIIQLCLTFTVFFWMVLQPLLADYLCNQSKKSLYESVLDHPCIREKPAQEIQRAYEELKMENVPVFSFVKLLRGFFSHSIFVLTWVILSLSLSFLLLKRIEGTKECLYLLPLVIVCYAIFLFLYPPKFSAHTLFPTEETLTHYGNDDPLQKRWQIYLIREWGQELESNDLENYQTQLNRATFFFNYERALRLAHGDSAEGLIVPYQLPANIFELVFFLGWNIFVAAFTNRKQALNIMETQLTT